MTIPARYAHRLWISSAELTELAPITRRKVAEMCADGVLKARKEGHEWWVEADSAWRWLGAKVAGAEDLRPNVARMLGRA